jgi:hypothetical protein
MKTAMLGMVGIAAAGVYATSGGNSGSVRHERIVNQPPEVVFNALAYEASSFRGRTGRTFSRGQDGQSWPITYRFDAKPNEYVSLVSVANNTEIADVTFSIAPADGGKTRLTADIDLDGAPVNIKPNFALFKAASAKALDVTVASIENGMSPSLQGWDYGSAMGEAERRESVQRGIHPEDPTRAVMVQRREREEKMRAAAKPMVDVGKHGHRYRHGY